MYVRLVSAAEETDFVLGHAYYMKAIHGGQGPEGDLWQLVSGCRGRRRSSGQSQGEKPVRS